VWQGASQQGPSEQVWIVVWVTGKYNKIKELAERVGFEFTRKRSFNNIKRTAGTVKQWKAVVGSANGSQTDHGSVIA
jgi:hypothetical protein